MPEQLTLYFHKLSPYSHRIELALAEANIQHKACKVDLFNKPKWFAEKVNPIGKVPAITYGGPDVDPEDPSPLSFKLAESSVILQFIAELYPESGLLPNDPVERAKVLFFMDTVDRHFDAPGNEWMGGRTESYEGYLKGIEMIQGLLPESGEFAVGDRYTIADASIVPLLSRLKITYETDIGSFQVGQGHKLGEELKTSKFAMFMKYAQGMLERPSLRDSNDEVYLAETWKKLIAWKSQQASETTTGERLNSQRLMTKWGSGEHKILDELKSDMHIIDMKKQRAHAEVDMFSQVIDDSKQAAPR